MSFSAFRTVWSQISAALENDSLKAMLYEIAPEYKLKIFEETGDVDFGYEIPNISRFRANFFNQKNGIGAVFRQIPSKVLSFEDFEKFDAPLPAVLKKFAMLLRDRVAPVRRSASEREVIRVCRSAIVE